MSTIPLIAIIGRPNVGKSTLFNCLIKKRLAIVADTPGVTRDRLEGEGVFEEIPFKVIDTGGLDEAEDELSEQMLSQSWEAARQADKILFVVDGRAGLTPYDKIIANQLRKLSKTVFLIVNKTDGVSEHTVISDFYQLGFKEILPIAASHNKGIVNLLSEVLSGLPAQPEKIREEIIKIAVIGRPNVGKSTLINRLLGENRVVVCDHAGTTRDAIEIPFQRFDQKYTLIDTAGMRRKARITDHIEQNAVRKTMDALERAHVALMVLDAREKISDQDLTLLNLIESSGRALVVLINKWDGLHWEEKDAFKADLWRLHFVRYAKTHFISALHGTGVGDLLNMAEEAYQQAHQPLNTGQLTKILLQATEKHPPPLVRGRQVKLRYAHCGGHHPPTIIIHGKQTEELPKSYQTYLKNFMMKALSMKGTSMRLIYKSDKNPYVDTHSH